MPRKPSNKENKELEQRVKEFEKKAIEDEMQKVSLQEAGQLNELLIDSLPYPVMLVRRDRTVLAANRKAQEVGAKVNGYCWRDFGNCEYISGDDKRYINEHEGNFPPGGTKCTFCLADEALKANKPTNQPNVKAFGEVWEPWWIPIHDDLYLHYAINITQRNKLEKELVESKHFLESVFDAIQDGVSVLDCDLNIIRVNSWIEKKYAAQKPLVGKKCYVAFQQRESPCPWCPSLPAMSTGNANSEIVPYPSEEEPNGWMDVFAFPLKDSDGRVVGVIEHLRDITERKRAEEALRDSEKRYRTLFEDSRDAIYITTREGEFIDANLSALDLFGYTREEMIGLNARQIYVNPDKRVRFQRGIEKKGFVRDYEVKFRKKNGIEMDCLVTSSLRRSKDGTIVGYQGIIRDITEQKRAQEEKEKFEVQLCQAQKMEAVGTLAGGIAHDFNNILTPMIIHTEIALSNIEEESPVRDNLLRVSKAAYRAKDVVRQILTFSRQAPEKSLPMKVAPVVEEVLKLLRASLPTTIEIRQDIKSTSDLTVADPTQIHQILINLCTNAAHAMCDKGGVLDVSLTDIDLGAKDAVKYPNIKPGPFLRLTVSDTGTGIDRTVIDRIFDPFFTTKQMGEGTGMGLALVHGIVTSCGGAITVDSEPKKGTTFHVFFPRTETGATQQILPAGPLPTGNERILFVDDSKIVIEAVRPLLESLGYKVVVRMNGLEALEVFRPQPEKFDIVITDQTMPHMPGKELAQELINIRPSIPIILCTGYSELITEQEAKAMGIQEYVMKPFAIDDMARIIRKVLDE